MHVIDRQKKSSIIQRPMADAIRKMEDKGVGHIVHLIRQHRLMIPPTFLELLIHCSLAEN